MVNGDLRDCNGDMVNWARVVVRWSRLAGSKVIRCTWDYYSSGGARQRLISELALWLGDSLPVTLFRI